MSDKATSLTQIYNIFKPMALTEKQQGYYQKTAFVRSGDNYEFHDFFFQSIKQSDDFSRLLVVGHSGCGKSTELRMLGLSLRNETIPFIEIEATDDLDIYNFSYIDLFMSIVSHLAEFSAQEKLNIHKSIYNAFQAALSNKITSDYWEEAAEAKIKGEATLAVKVPFLKVMMKIASLLKMSSGYKEELRQEIKPKMPEVLSALNAFLDAIKSQTGYDIVIIIDGLEKCQQECVRRLFVEDISAIVDINAHLIVACPMWIYRSIDGAILAGNFPFPTFMPMIKTHNIDSSPFYEGINVIKELVLKRTDTSFFEEGVLEKIIASSGGNLRDFCNLLSNSAFEAYMNKRETVDIDSADKVLNGLAYEVFLRVPERDYKSVK
ncbi:MAG: KAP family NTPase, partial [Eggerthellaceae bacterium]|nr:KAP family NTPase [Eggerthellaceae bacterium]